MRDREREKVFKKKKVSQTKPRESSKLWEELNKNLYNNINNNFLNNFRKPDNPTNRFSTWPPKEPTFRYYLTLVFNEVLKKNRDFFKNYKKLGNTLLGQPLCVSANGVQVNLDYLISIEEYDFLSQNLNLESIESIVEIGAGFGRTAHTLLKLCPNIKKYTIIDLPPMLKLASKYLKKVLSNELIKLNFIETTEIKKIKETKFDLGINIDSFQEMPKQVIFGYINNLFAKTKNVYIKNPVCKYPSKLLGIKQTKKYDVFSLGYITEVADIFNEVQLNIMRKIYAEKYSPSHNHKIVKASPSNLFTYYQHILYNYRNYEVTQLRK